MHRVAARRHDRSLRHTRRRRMIHVHVHVRAARVRVVVPRKEFCFRVCLFVCLLYFDISHTRSFNQTATHTRQTRRKSDWGGGEGKEEVV